LSIASDSAVAAVTSSSATNSDDINGNSPPRDAGAKEDLIADSGASGGTNCKQVLFGASRRRENASGADVDT
jgi:hypothetical protein